jgi:hypothetical protein
MTDKDVERVGKIVFGAMRIAEAAKLGTVSLTSFDGHCVRIDFPNREDAERMYAVLTKGSE